MRRNKNLWRGVLFVALVVALHTAFDSGSAIAQFAGSLWFPDSSNQLTPVDSNFGVKIPSLTNCDTIDTDANGVFSCGSDSGAAGSDPGWIVAELSGTAYDTSSSSVRAGLFRNGLVSQASSTISSTLSVGGYLGASSTAGFTGLGTFYGGLLSTASSTFSSGTTTFIGGVHVGTTSPYVDAQTNDWVFGEDRLVHMVSTRDTQNYLGNIQFWNTSSTTKAGLEWYDHNGNSVAWLLTHYTNSGADPTDHTHLELETSDTSGAKQGRLTIGYDCDFDCKTTINQSNLYLTRNSGQTNGNLYMEGGGTINNSGGFRMIPNYALNTKIFSVATDTSDRININVQGDTVIGFSDAIVVTASGMSSFSNQLAIGTTTADSTIDLEIGQNGSSGTTIGPQLDFRQIATAINSTSNNQLGKITFSGNDKAAGELGIGAEIKAVASTFWNATTNDYPTDLVISTTPDGSSALTERLRIASDGTLTIDTSASLVVNSTASSTFANGIDLSGGAFNTRGDNYDGGYYINDIKILTASTSQNTVSIGPGAGASLLSGGTDNLFLGANAGNANQTQDFNTAIGSNAMKLSTDSRQSVAIGANALEDATNADFAIAIGYLALGDYQSGLFNIAIGRLALGEGQLTGNNNVAIGDQSQRYNPGSNNVTIGGDAGADASANFTDNVFIGDNSGLNAETGGQNIFIGSDSGDALTTGSHNIVIGYDIDAISATGDNTLNIGALIFGTGLDAADSATSSGNIGIGTTTPSQKLSVEGNVLADAYLEFSPLYIGDALSAIKNIKPEQGSEKGDWAKVDHDTLPSGVRYEERDIPHLRKAGVEMREIFDHEMGTTTEEVPIMVEDTVDFVGRDLGASVQLNVRAIQQLLERVEDLENENLQQQAEIEALKLRMNQIDGLGTTPVVVNSQGALTSTSLWAGFSGLFAAAMTAWVMRRRK